jgi:Immunoglobulin domain
MKKTLNFFQRFKALLLISLLAGPGLAVKSVAAVNTTWTGTDFVQAPDGSYYAYWNDPNNWSGGYIPSSVGTDPSQPDYQLVDAAVFNSGDPLVACVVTNDTQIGMLFLGWANPGGGILEITNGATFQAGVQPGGTWTGVGYVGGPGTLIVGPGSTFTCTSHLWVGQYPTVGTVIDDGGTISIPSGQLGLGWNGSTNYFYVTNGANLYLSQLSPQTLGYPGSYSGGAITNLGYLDIGAGSSVVISNNNLLTYSYTFNSGALAGQTVNLLNLWETNGQLIAYEGTGKIQATYNPAQNLTILTAIPPVSQNTPIFSVEPTNAVVGLNSTATFNALVSNVSVTYQWQFNGTALTDGNGITGSKTATLTIANVSAAETGSYSVIATNSSQTAFSTASTPATLSANSFNLYPVITINGINTYTYEVQYTSSLASPVTWTTLGTYTLGAGALQVVDTGSPLSLGRFYRVVQITQ